MIEFGFTQNGDLTILQRDVPPSVYLDHWALRKLSEDDKSATRFAAALKSRSGTLALSWLNLAEFVNVTVEEQARKVETLLEASLPQVFFLDVEPFAVISREDELLAGGPPVPPHADQLLLRAFAQLKPTTPTLFTARDLFKVIVDNNERLGKGFGRLAETIIGRVEALRGELDANLEFRTAVRRPPRGPQIQRGTRFILRELVRTLLVDRATKMTRNQAIDLLHAVVPVAYCDLVLLDKHWETQVDRARSRLNAAGILVPIGTVFSDKNGGIERFLDELESS